MTIDWSKTDAEILAWYDEILTFKTYKKTRFTDIEEQFPGKGYRSLVINSVAQAAKTDPEAQVVFYAASNDGTDLSDEYAKSKIRQIAAIFEWPEELTSWILNRSSLSQPRWENLGLSKPTLESIANERRIYLEGIAKEERDRAYSEIREMWIGKYSSILSWISSQQHSGAPVPTIDDIVAQIKK